MVNLSKFPPFFEDSEIFFYLLCKIAKIFLVVRDKIVLLDEFSEISKLFFKRTKINSFPKSVLFLLSKSGPHFHLVKVIVFIDEF